MLKKEIFKRAFWTLFAVGVLNLVATELHLHWSLWWIDVILHFLGGLCVALFALWLGSVKSDLKNWRQGKILLVALAGAIFVGILWEIYELYVGLTFLSDGARYFADTGSDLMMDFVGGIFGFLYANNLLKKYE